VIRLDPNHRPRDLATVLLAGSTFAQGVAPAPITVITPAAAPIFAVADDSQTFLVMTTQGLRLTVPDGSAGS
jgi:hypothetical protein